MRALIAAMLAAGLVLAGVVLVGNDYRVHPEKMTIRLSGQQLHAVLSTPRDGTAQGLIVVVHGDGPVDATHEGLYLPWFEAAADAGYATLSWSKPGVGGSSGNWLDQSMDDRAEETSMVIDWAKRSTEIPTDRIVLWGASQAGWVLPKVAATRADITGVVAVSPAINWLRQGRYNLLAELDHENADSAARHLAITRSDQTRSLLDQGADYASYLSQTSDPEPMPKDRWEFVASNYTSDATADLASMADRDTPVLLMLGEHDRNVDIEETEATYKQLFEARVTVEHFDAAHSMARPIVEDSDAIGLATGTVWPRALIAGGVLDSYCAYLRKIE